MDRDRKTDSQTDRQTDRKTYRQGLEATTEREQQKVVTERKGYRERRIKIDG